VHYIRVQREFKGIIYILSKFKGIALVKNKMLYKEKKEIIQGFYN
jgi:hypothetical protein